MDYLTPEEIASELRVDISTIRRWIKAGQLPSIRVGRQYRILRSEYEAFLRRKEVPRESKQTNDLALAI